MSVITRVRQRLLGNRFRPGAANSQSPIGASAALTPGNLLDDGRKILSDAQLAEWDENGYLVLPRFMPHGRVRELNSQVDALWRERKKDDHGLVVDAFIGTSREKRIPFAKATDRVRAKPYKLNDLYLESELVRETILDPELVEVLYDLLDGAPVVSNTLSMERGSQQRMHCDTFYIAPAEPNRMVGAMVLLEGTKAGAGPLRFYPGSHKIPPYEFSDGRLNQIADELDDFDEYIGKEIADRGLLPLDFAGNAGDVLIWHAQLYNGGAPIDDAALTQKTVVAHYLRLNDIPRDNVVDLGGERYYMQRPHQATS